MTAEEFLERQRIYKEIKDSSECEKVRGWMIEFAKYHVEKALEAAEEVETYDEHIVLHIRKCYPLNNIK